MFLCLKVRLAVTGNLIQGKWMGGGYPFFCSPQKLDSKRHFKFFRIFEMFMAFDIISHVPIFKMVTEVQYYYEHT